MNTQKHRGERVTDKVYRRCNRKVYHNGAEGEEIREAKIRRRRMEAVNNVRGGLGKGFFER